MAILQAPAGQHKEFRAFKMTDEGDISDYLGVKVERLANGCIKLSQPQLIRSIIKDMGFNERTGSKRTPAASTVKLSRDLYGQEINEDWHYWSITIAIDSHYRYVDVLR